jgi:hypothetical protein
VYVSSGSFSNAATADITGFTTTFLFYRVIIDAYRHSGTGSTVVTATLRTSSAAGTGGYYGAGWKTDYLAASGIVAARNNGTDFQIGTVYSQDRTTTTFVDVANVGQATFHPTLSGYYMDTAAAQNVTFGYQLAGSNNIDRIRIACAVNMTGKWRVYGYREP